MSDMTTDARDAVLAAIDMHWTYGTPGPEPVFAHQEHDIIDCPLITVALDAYQAAVAAPLVAALRELKGDIGAMANGRTMYEEHPLVKMVRRIDHALAAYEEQHP